MRGTGRIPAEPVAATRQGASSPASIDELYYENFIDACDACKTVVAYLLLVLDINPLLFLCRLLREGVQLSLQGEHYEM